MTVADRHLSLDGFRKYVGSGVAISHPIEGRPRLVLTIDAASLILRGPRKDGERLPQTGLEHVRVVPGGSDGQQMEVRVTDPALFLDAYPILCAIADRVQLDGHGLAEAVRDTLRLLGRFLRRTTALPRERELGLCGELLVLIGLCAVVGPIQAVAGWRGPHHEEHDFAVEGHDLEVKTTASERRTHWIDSLTQLEPTGDAPLWIASHQLTEAGPSTGWHVAGLISAARKAVGLAARDGLERRLDAAGWTDTLDEEGLTRWRRRVPSAAFSVAGQFPRLTSGMLSRAAISHQDFAEVRYRIDLTGHECGRLVPDVIARSIATEVHP